MSKRVLLVLLLVAGFATAALSVEHVVSQKNRKFSVQSMTVKVGDTVVFHNEDQVSHNVFSASPGQSFDLKIQRPGQKSSHTFMTPGTAEMRCAIHPDMKMQITITE